MKRPPLPQASTPKLVFTRNPYNSDLFQAIDEGRNVATIQKYTEGFHLYVDGNDRQQYEEGYFETFEKAEYRANWRRNLK
jgi:hypothetical protein